MNGTLHLSCTYLKIITKKMVGFGLFYVIFETGLIRRESVQRVLNEKHYDRAIQCQKIVLESLETILLK